VKNLLDEEDQKRTYEVLETSARAVKFINQLFVHEENYLKLLIRKYVETMQPLTCMLIQTNSSFQRVTYSFGVSKRTIQYLNEDLTIYTKIKEIVSGKSFSIVPNSSSIHRKLKELLKINLGDYVIIVHFSLLGKHYTLLFSFERKTEEIEGNRNQLTKALWAHIQNYVKTKQTAKQVSSSYIELLKCLADMLDEMSPFTVGYSKQMSRYSMAIAKEMGLSEFQVRSVGLSAYLSNIGVIGLTDGLLSKEGKYTEEEFEQMKLHSEVGEAIIENTIAQEEIALNIRYHHERVDGNGYPSRLVGEEIPIGARIIAVVQTFLAKINGRSYRDPLPFDDALKLLKQASGSQLDSRIVVTFLNWYEQKRKQTINSNKALGSCWELLCTPSSICLQCPAYGQTSKNCWEYQGNNCLAHGKTCETCFVYTEAMTRLDRSKKVVKQG
jgi:HD-GYP domain-containing protein (c-di-GMP phosphodiesterase class II)